MELNNKESLLLKSLINFYRHEKNLQILLRFLKGKQRRLSLRLLDWLVTNYSKNHAVVIRDTTNKCKNVEFMYLAYKNHLKSYSKNLMNDFVLSTSRRFCNHDCAIERVSFFHLVWCCWVCRPSPWRSRKRYGKLSYHYWKKKKSATTNFDTCIACTVQMTLQFK